MIENRLDILIHKWEMGHRQRLTHEALAQETGLARATIVAWRYGYVTRFDAKVLEALCSFFGIQPGDLLVYDSNGQN